MLPQEQSKKAQDDQGAEMDAAIFDRVHLGQYTAGDQALERELLMLFLAQFAPVRAQLDAAITPAEWKFAAHSIKGSARSIGAPEIASLSEKLEDIDVEGKEKGALLAALDRAMAAFAREVEKITS